jgi:hypothetical protein
MPPHGFVDFGAVVAILGWQSHDGLVYFGWDGRHVRERFVGPFPPLVESIFHRSASMNGPSLGESWGLGRCLVCLWAILKDTGLRTPVIATCSRVNDP